MTVTDACTAAVHALLHPTSVAIVGARDRPGGWADRIRTNLLRFRFEGAVHAINPRHATLWGKPAFPDIAAFPEAPDHLVVLVPPEAAVATLSGAAALGVRSATVFSSGGPGSTFGDELAAIARDTALVISGPNCLGNISVLGKLVTTTEARIEEIVAGPVAVVGQSGGIVHSLNRVLTGRGYGVRYVVSSGDETCTTTADYLRYFGRDPELRVVVTFVESVRDWPAFLDACAALRAVGKHMIAIKVGQSAESRVAAASHTGALAGAYAAFEAAAATAGVVTVPSMDVAVEACEYLTRLPPPKGTGIGAITLSGGVRELLLDAAARHDARLPELGATTIDALGALVGGEVEVSNPQDVGYAGVSSVDTMVACAQALARDGAIDVVLVQEELLTHEVPSKMAALATFDTAFAGASRSVPVALFSMCSPAAVTPYGRETRERHGSLVFLQSVEKTLAAVTAIGRAEQVADRRADAAAERPDTAAAAARVRALLRAAPLTEVVAKAALAEYGFATPREGHAVDADDARRVAETLTAPYVVKVVSTTLTHKLDAGGVVLGVPTPDAVAACCTEMAARVPDVEGFLVVEQVAQRIEFVVGFARDPEVGPVVMVGAGGTGVEAYEDVAFVPLPCSRADARDAIARTRAGSRLLGPWRGRPGGDEEALVSAVCAMSWFAEDLADVVSSAEINPLVALPGRTGVLVLDALVLPAT